ncbi:MAG: ABC transporter ATP-binding protein [Treponemataceae bacterium]|nr:MAG: ABC transporter ATP-binding protein [Treponemataceae bacterium]
MNSTESFIDVKNVGRTYTDTDGNGVTALSKVNLQIDEGEFVTLIGPSGCGKTTLLRLIAGLDAPQAGEVYVDGKIVTEPSHERGFIFQAPTLFPWATVAENVAIGLKARGVFARGAGDVGVESARKTTNEKIQKYIDLIGLTGFENSYPHEISGGMAQRAAIIRALINESRVLLLDEPLGALDAFKRMELQDQLLEIHARTKSTFVMVTHDVDEAVYLSGRIVVMTPRPGKIVEIINVPEHIRKDRNSAEFTAMRKKVLEALQLVSKTTEDGNIDGIEYAI